MRIEDHLCSLDQSARLYELGVRQHTAHWFRNDHADNPGRYPNQWYVISDFDYPLAGEHKPVKYDNNGFLLNAFTVSELGLLLPMAQYNFQQGKIATGEKWFMGYGIKYVYGMTEAECRANMLIHLIEEKDLVV